MDGQPSAWIFVCMVRSGTVIPEFKELEFIVARLVTVFSQVARLFVWSLRWHYVRARLFFNYGEMIFFWKFEEERNKRYLTCPQIGALWELAKAWIRSDFELAMQIFIKTLTGRKQQLNFEGESTVLEVKQALQEKEGIQVDQIRLIYSGKQLSDEKTLQEYNVVAGGTIHMVLQLR